MVGQNKNIVHTRYAFCYFNICNWTLKFHMFHTNSHYCRLFVEYLPEDGRKSLNT